MIFKFNCTLDIFLPGSKTYLLSIFIQRIIFTLNFFILIKIVPIFIGGALISFFLEFKKNLIRYSSYFGTFWVLLKAFLLFSCDNFKSTELSK
jgi:hypothetical protein